MNRKVTFEGAPLTLVGRNVKEGMQAPYCKMVDGGLAETVLEEYAGKIKIVTSFPSLDTPVCDLQVKEFNKRAIGMSEDIVVLGISKDLPFAQQRFCQENKIDKVKVLSDYKYNSFGINYGLLIKELNLLARSVMILDKGDTIRYIQLVPEITQAPDYEAVLAALEGVITSKGGKGSFSEKRCKPCEKGVGVLSEDIIADALAEYDGWEVLGRVKAVKEFMFKDFAEAKYFVDLVSSIAEEQGHHPEIAILWNKVKITLRTYAADGITENDLILAGIIEELL